MCQGEGRGRGGEEEEEGKRGRRIGEEEDGKEEGSRGACGRTGDVTLGEVQMLPSAWDPGAGLRR